MKHQLESGDRRPTTHGALVEDKTQAEKMASFGFSAVDIGAAAATVDAADGATESAEIDLALDSMNIIKDSLCMACACPSSAHCLFPLPALARMRRPLSRKSTFQR